ncbi:HU family DNA-binding protein [Hallella colorans]|uniref:HU family DNA-binding protein n=1 Tax=Hallella colorans TaxID=1703337 RepID=UPI0035D0F9E8
MEKKQNKFPNKKKILYLCNSITKEYQQYQIKNISEMTKADIISEITEQTGLQKKEVAVVIESFMETVKRCMLDKKENVYLRGFGSFIIKRRAAKTARDIGKNTTITIPAHNLPSFKPAKAFVDEMKGE